MIFKDTGRDGAIASWRGPEGACLTHSRATAATVEWDWGPNHVFSPSFIMSQNLNRNPANSVNGANEYIEVRGTTLGREFRGLQSEPDRHQATAEEINDFSGFIVENSFEGFEDFEDFEDFEGFGNMDDNFCNFSDTNDFSGFSSIIDFKRESTEINDFSGFNKSYKSDDTLNFSGFVNEVGIDGYRGDNCDLNNNNDVNNPNRNSNIRDNRNRKSFNNRRVIKVGTWNVRTMSQDGKFEEVEKEMKRMKLNILGLSEVRWTGAGKVDGDGLSFYYSGGEKLERGVGIMVSKPVAGCVMGYWAVSDRVIVVKIKGHPFNVNIIQVYAPTQESTEEEVDEFYDQVAEAQNQCKSQDITLVLGDFNAKVGKDRYEDVVGPFGLGERNFRGERLISWCDASNLVLTNTWFKKHPRLLWTWKSPGGRNKNQIDYITINKRFRNAVRDVRTYPGADCYSDHVPVVADIVLKLKKVIRRKREDRREIKQLITNEQLKEAYRIEVENRYEALNSEEPLEGEEEMDREWRYLGAALTETAREMVPKQQRRGRQRWMTEEILDMMEERRTQKERNPQRYVELNLEIRRACDEAKEEWINEQCREVEELERQHKIESMHRKIKEVTGRKRLARGNVIKNKEGVIVMEIEEVLKRWEEYVKDLFDDNRGEKPRLRIPMNGPDLLNEEVISVIKSFKKGKSPGNDEVTIEMILASGEFGMRKIAELARRIYETGYIPKEMYKSIFIAIPKKPGAVECNLFRTISLMSQITKIILKVILNRIKQKLKPEISEEQYGFVKGKGTRNAIFIIRMLTERAIEMQKDVYMCFIDYEKAFDRVRHTDLIEILQRINLDGKDIRLINNLYWSQMAAVNIDNNLTSWIEIKRGVRQGCVLSPDLFSIYGEIIMRSIMGMEGITIGGVNINNIRYADDTVIIADSAEKLQLLLNTVNRESELMGLKINIKKTEVVVTSKNPEPPNCNILINDERIKQSSNFVYLGSMVTQDGRSNQEIQRRILIAKNAFKIMKNLLTNNRISAQTRTRALKTYVWSTLMYGSESWTMTEEIKHRLRAVEMWFYRRMLRISWRDRVTNEEVMARMGVQRALVKEIRKRQLDFIGHIIRREQLEHLCLTGRIEGRRARGRQRMKYMDSIVGDVEGNHSANQLIRWAGNRERWRLVIANVQDRVHR